MTFRLDNNSFIKRNYHEINNKADHSDNNYVSYNEQPGFC